MSHDREKVMNGLECCQYSSKSHCDGCPYAYDGLTGGLTGILDCTADLAEDTLALLKEQDEKKKYRIPFSPDSNVQWTT